MLDIYVAIFFSFFYFESILLCSRLDISFYFMLSIIRLL